MPKTSALFIIVRHGNTFEAGEPARRIGARTDLPLTAQGLRQGEALGVHLAATGLQFERALVSPLLRTRQTADAIVAAQPGTVATQTADFLREIDHGPDENRTEDEVLTRIGAAALTAWDSDAIAPPGWLVGAATRIAAWRSLFDAATVGQSPLLLVTSNGAARFALLAAGIAPAQGLKLATGSYGMVCKAADGTLSVPIWGRRP